MERPRLLSLYDIKILNTPCMPITPELQLQNYITAFRANLAETIAEVKRRQKEAFIRKYGKDLYDYCRALKQATKRSGDELVDCRGTLVSHLEVQGGYDHALSERFLVQPEGKREKWMTKFEKDSFWLY